MKLWGSRFGQELDAAAWKLNASIDFDRRLASQDVRGSQAWARALNQAGVLTDDECTLISDGLQAIAGEFLRGKFVFSESDEDIHTAVERRLGEIIGALAGKLHTGRSRNDQVATDFRLWLLDHLQPLDELINGLQRALIQQAESDPDSLIPGYTHLQPAQPLLLSHWWLSHFWPLQRDRERLRDLTPRTAILPLGCGALAGTPFLVDRCELAVELGFLSPAQNSLDGVSDRDFAAEFLFCASLIVVHLSKLAEAVILFSSAEFGFFELSDAYATGSSLMPQKKNPDVFELARGKSGTLLGSLTGLLATLKGLPSVYDKDLQEDKLPVFQAYDQLAGLLPVLAGAIRSLKTHPERMESRIQSAMMAADLADYLVARGIPFRQAHGLAGQAVKLAYEQNIGLHEISLETWQSLDPAFDDQVFEVFDPHRSVSRRNAIGGTAPQVVAAQLALAQQLVERNMRAQLPPLADCK
jgi:argininosuccinate lyase